jgi:hypothetical protein
MKQPEHDTPYLDINVIAEFKTNSGNVKWYISLVIRLYTTRCWPFAGAHSFFAGVIKLVRALCSISVPNIIGSDGAVQLIQCLLDGNTRVVD